MIHMISWFIDWKTIELGLLVSGMSTVWEETDGFTNQYRRDLAIYIMTVLLYFYGVIMDRAITSPGHGNITVDGIDATDKHYLK